jgi:hypothetical protein
MIMAMGELSVIANCGDFSLETTTIFSFYFLGRYHVQIGIPRFLSLCPRLPKVSVHSAFL